MVKAAPNRWPYVSNVVHPRPRPERKTSQTTGANLAGDNQTEGGSALPKQTPRDAALALMVNRGVPVPSEWVPDFPLPSALFILHEVARGVMEQAVVFFGEMNSAGDEVDDTAADVLNSVAQCLAGSVHALVSLDLLPQSAEDAMTEIVDSPLDTMTSKLAKVAPAAKAV